MYYLINRRCCIIIESNCLIAEAAQQIMDSAWSLSLSADEIMSDHSAGNQCMRRINLSIY